MKQIRKQINFKELGKGILLIILCLFIIPLIIGLLFSSLPISESVYAYTANGLNYFILIVILVSIYINSLWEDLKDFKKNWKKYVKIALKNWFIAYVFMILSNIIIISFLGNIADNEAANRTIIDSYPILSFFLMVVFGPFIEELLFRKGLKNAFSNPKWFMFVSAFLFGFSHLIASLDFTSMDAFLKCLPQMIYIIPYGGMGYFMAKCYVETNNFYTSVVFHTFHNLLNVALIILMGLLV